MVSLTSQLYKEHPDWCLHVPSRLRTTGRNQLVLDFTRSDVRDNIFGQLSDLLSSGGGVFDYVKVRREGGLTVVVTLGRSLAPVLMSAGGRVVARDPGHGYEATNCSVLFFFFLLSCTGGWCAGLVVLVLFSFFLVGL